MGREGITYAHVAEAADRLRATGVNPTVDSVRSALGNTGSKGTIAPLLKKWKAEQNEAGETTRSKLPPELIEAVGSVYDRIETEAKFKVDQMRIAFDEDREKIEEQLESERKSLAEERAQLVRVQAEKDSVQAELTKSGIELVSETMKRQNMAVEMASLQAENEGLEQRLADRAAENRALTEQLTQARQQFIHYQEKTAEQRQEERQSYESRISVLERDLNLSRSESQMHREGLAVVRTNNTSLESKVVELVDAAKQQAQLLSEANAALVTASKLESAQEVKINMLTEWLGDSKKTNADLAEELQGITKENSQLATTNGELQKQVEALETRLKEAKEGLSPSGPEEKQETRKKQKS